MPIGDESLSTRLDHIEAQAEKIARKAPDTRDEARRIEDLVQEIKPTLPSESDFRQIIREVVGSTLSQEQVARLASAFVDLTQGRQ